MLRHQATSSAAKKELFSTRDVFAGFLDNQKNIIFSRNSKMGFAKKLKRKSYAQKSAQRSTFSILIFLILHHKPKLMLKFLQNGFRIVIVQKTRQKGLSHLVKMHFSVTGNVTLGVVRWRHKLDNICPLWVLPNLVHLKHTCVEL